MAEMLPVEYNPIVNPSFEMGSAGWATGASTALTRTSGTSTEWAYAGKQSYRMVSVANSGANSIGFIRTGLLIDVPSGGNCLLQWRYKTDSPVVQIYAYISWHDAADVFIGSNTGPIVTPGATEGLYSWEVETFAGAVKAYFYMYHRYPLADQFGTFHWDGVDLRFNSPVAAYLDGDQGSGAYWTGTPHNSPSERLAIPISVAVGKGGITTLVPTITRSDRTNAAGVDLTDLFTSGEIDVDMDREIKAIFKGNLREAGAVVAYDIIAVHFRLEHENGDVEARQVGLFQLDQPKIELSDAGSTVAVTGKDMTVMLAESTFVETYNVAGGINLAGAIKTLLQYAGFTVFQIPDLGKLTPTDGFSWKPDETLLKAVNDMLEATGAYTLYTSDRGMPTSIPYRRLGQVQPSHIYTVGQDSDLLDKLQISPTNERVFNVVIVTRSANPARPVLRSIRKNLSTSSAISTRSIRERAKTVEVPLAVDQSVVDLRAIRELEESGTYVAVKLEVLPDLQHRPHQTVEIRIDDLEGGALYSGRYWVKGYSFGLEPSNAALRLKLRKVEDYG